MAGRVEGKVAFITGAARGQGRSHALRLAQEGADIIAVDICGQIGTRAVRDGHARRTWPRRSRQVEALDRRIVATQADVRDYGALKAALSTRGWPSSAGSTSSSANAGIFGFSTGWRT